MKSNSVHFILLMAVLLVNAADVSARFWRTGAHGVRFDFSCRFGGGDIYQTMTPHWHECIDSCAAESRCTHFSHGDGRCYLNHIGGGQHEKSHRGWVCGWVPGRSGQTNK